MKKVCFVIPYFGKLPNYFPLFLKSCATNTSFNWLLLTDDESNYNYPPNVKRILISFNTLRELFAKKFDFKIALETPYKLCDFKPTYGYVFEEYLKEYLFWGHCDIDMLLGNLNAFLSDAFLSKYDKIFALGHMTLYRNSFENNRVFMSSYKGRLLYKEYLSCPQICVFDEDCKNEYNIHNIFKSKGKRVFEGDFSLNFDISCFNFRKIHYVGLNLHPLTHGHIVERYKKSLYLWKNGEILCHYMNEKGAITCDKYLYLHLQMRKMFMESGVQDSGIIRISPNYFSIFKAHINKSFFENYAPFVNYPNLLKDRLMYAWLKVRRFCGRVIRRITLHTKN